jgi:Fe-S-cluster containining protein
MIKHIIFWFQKLFSSKFVLNGKCKQCGQCCRKIAFYLDKKLIKTKQQFEKLKKLNKKYNHFYISGRDIDGALFFTCKSLTDDNKCKDYMFRSIACRNYPKINPEFIINGGEPLDNCGYNFGVNKKFSEYIELNESNN